MNAIESQPRLLTVPMVALMPLGMRDGNRLLEEWGHYLGAVNRPYHQECFTLEMDDKPVSVAVSGSIVSDHVKDCWAREEVVELTRLCSRPGCSWATLPMLRLWREVCAPRWPCWPVKVAVAYSQNGRHNGGIYRMDGWELLDDKCGSNGGGTWSRPRYAGDAAHGPKTLWAWDYEHHRS